MGPSFFFILCEYIEHVQVYLYTCSKFVTNFVMGLKVSCQVGGLGQKFQIYSRQVTFLFFDLKVRFFFHHHQGGLFCEKIPIFYFFVLRILLRILLMILQVGFFSNDFTKDFTTDFNRIFTKEPVYLQCPSGAQ